MQNVSLLPIQRLLRKRHPSGWVGSTLGQGARAGGQRAGPKPSLTPAWQGPLSRAQPESINVVTWQGWVFVILAFEDYNLKKWEQDAVHAPICACSLGEGFNFVNLAYRDRLITSGEGSERFAK